ncbi:universal stress protein [Marimonas sp. MJW-29]|uniref:Universal stress protein n=1 Tax=Sulfitobacter sediminis TaxID=3234186 RepID=A0ABV3RPR8_9RHOB
MRNLTTLFLVNAETPDDVISRMAEAAAASETHLSCQLLGPAPALPMYAYGVPPYGGMNIPDNWAELVEEAHEKHRARGDEIEAILSKAAAPGDVQPVLCVPAEMKRQVARRARVCDVAYLADNLREAPDIFREAANGVLFHSPIGLMLNRSPLEPAARVFVAWDSSEAASKAVHAALPQLKAAEEVTIGCFDPVMTEEMQGVDPGTDVAGWLSHHGCKVTLSQFPSGGREIGKCIQDRAKETGANLVVMGAYGHARLIETVFGGTTHTMIEQTDLPVLLAH